MIYAINNFFLTIPTSGERAFNAEPSSSFGNTGEVKQNMIDLRNLFANHMHLPCYTQVKEENGDYQGSFLARRCNRKLSIWHGVRLSDLVKHEGTLHSVGMIPTIPLVKVMKLEEDLPIFKILISQTCRSHCIYEK
jgi:hypothetical protein